MASGGMGRCPVVALGTPAEKGLKASRILILHHPLKVLFLHPPRTPFLQSPKDHYPPSSPNFFFLQTLEPLSFIPLKSHHPLVSPGQSLTSLGHPQDSSTTPCAPILILTFPGRNKKEMVVWRLSPWLPTKVMEMELLVPASTMSPVATVTL